MIPSSKSKASEVEKRAYDAIDALNIIVMQNTDADARAALVRVRAFADARIEQCTPRDMDEDLL